jgi:hypothetical protein
MYLYSGALGVVVSLKESMRASAGLESPGFEDMHDPGYLLLRIPLLRLYEKWSSEGISLL